MEPVWRQSKSAWLAFLPDYPDLRGDPMTKKVPALVRSLCIRLLSFGGTSVCVRFDEKECERLLQQGRLIRAAQIEFQFGEPGQCHANSAGLWRRRPRAYRIVTGYALIAWDGMWRQHSCVLTSDGRIIETTGECEKYYGLILSGFRAWWFARNNP